MNRLLFGFLSALTLLTFLTERYAGWYATECSLTQVIGLGALRLLFFLFFIIQILLPLYHWVRDPNFVTDALSGLSADACRSNCCSCTRAIPFPDTK